MAGIAISGRVHCYDSHCVMQQSNSSPL